MTGTPSEASIQTQWRNAVDVLETLRNFADGTMAAENGPLDALLTSLDGDYTPVELSNFAQRIRGGLSELLSSGVANQMIVPILFEYGRHISQAGTGIDSANANLRNPVELFRAIYDYFAAQSTPITVQSRNITYDTAAAGSSNAAVGLSLSRLTVDENNYRLEACTAEHKIFKCEADAQTGTRAGAEVFEVSGEQAAYDNLLRASFGSGETTRTTVVVKHAGTGQGGSLLNNSSFSDFSSTATNKFSSWTTVSGSANLSQESTITYVTPPGGTAFSLKMAGSGTATEVKQPLTDMRVRRLDADSPYFLRIMYYPEDSGGTANGTLELHLGSQSVTVTNSGWTAGQWNELVMPIGQNCWTRNFNQADLDINIKWNGTTGNMYVDDAVFCPWSLIDGTYYALRHNGTTVTHARVEDGFHLTDTYTAGTGKIQYFCFLAGLGYLPSTTGTPEFTDPS